MAKNDPKTRKLENNLHIPEWAIADHVNRDGGAVFFQGCTAAAKIREMVILDFSRLMTTNTILLEYFTSIADGLGGGQKRRTNTEDYNILDHFLFLFHYLKYSYSNKFAKCKVFL